MTIISYLSLAVGSFVAAWIGTLAMRRLAPRFGLVQIPNARSSHSTPTPQGGGVVIAAISVIVAIVACQSDSGFVVIVALSTTIAVLGLADDILDLSVALRFPIQGLVLAGLLGWALPLPSIVLPFGLIISGWIMLALVWAGALWWLNLFNFMDGIDGIAASQSIVILMGGLIIAYSADQSFLQAPIALLAVATAGAAAGFLVLNWAPARIFMGDAGSNTLAFLIIAFALSTIHLRLIDYPSWLILLSPFATDTTVALIRRTIRGELPWRAHRRHAYQQLSRRSNHARVTATYTAFALAAVPIAAAAQHYPQSSWWMVAIVYILLIAFVFRAGSGDAVEHGR